MVGILFLALTGFHWVLVADQKITGWVEDALFRDSDGKRICWVFKESGSGFWHPSCQGDTGLGEYEKREQAERAAEKFVAGHISK